jgi:hypothetical protein
MGDLLERRSFARSKCSWNNSRRSPDSAPEGVLLGDVSTRLRRYFWESKACADRNAIDIMCDCQTTCEHIPREVAPLRACQNDSPWKLLGRSLSPPAKLADPADLSDRRVLPATRALPSIAVLAHLPAESPHPIFFSRFDAHESI